MSAKTKVASVLAMMADDAVPLEHRKRLVQHLIMTGSAEGEAVLQHLLEQKAAAPGQELLAKKGQELAELIRQMQEGPLRAGIFIGMLPGTGAMTRAQVVLQDGTLAGTVVPDAELARSLRCGEPVFLEAQAKALLFRDPNGVTTGEEARLERRLDAARVLVSVRDVERFVFRASDELVRKLDAGLAVPGGSLLVCTRCRFAFDALAAPDGLSHYRYLSRKAPPDVLVKRDVGAPPFFLEELAEHVRIEMTNSELSRRYRLRRVVLKLLTGVSGSGKTLCIQAFWRRMYEVMAEVTGTPLADLPPRVLQLRMADVLSKWLGESDKQIDRFFDEVDQLADEPFVAADGSRYELPVLVICEECDGLGRTRGEEAIHDRIQTTLLQRLDVTSQKLKDKLVICLFTSNVPHLVDPAFLRRVGGTTEKFGRLQREAFRAVLHKHLDGLPFVAHNGTDQAKIRRGVARDLDAWLFCANGQDAGQVELTIVGAAEPETKYRRHFLNGALVDRAVQQASAEARHRELQGTDRPGLTYAGLAKAFDKQIRAVVDQLHRDNVGNYLDLPDGVRVASVRRLDQPALLPVELERAS